MDEVARDKAAAEARRALCTRPRAVLTRYTDVLAQYLRVIGYQEAKLRDVTKPETEADRNSGDKPDPAAT